MTRTLVNLDDDDKRWLDEQARLRHVPMTELVRMAVKDFRRRTESAQAPGLREMLQRTAGIRKGDDGLVRQVSRTKRPDCGGSRDGSCRTPSRQRLRSRTDSPSSRAIRGISGRTALSPC